MKNIIRMLVAGGMLTALCAPASAEGVSTNFGGDAYTAGDTVNVTEPIARDAFLAGRTVALTSTVAGDVHMAGFDVHSDTSIGGDVYAAGFAVTIGGTVAGDVTAMGNTVTVRTTAPIAGNVRAAGATVAVEASVDGSVLVTGETVTIDGPIRGDLSFYGQTLTFGPNAKVDGKVLVHAPKAIAVPEAVAAADRVTFELLTSPEYPREFGRTAETVAKSFWIAMWGAGLWWVLLLAVGAAMIALAPELLGKLQVISTVRPFRRIGLGVLILSAVIGLVPVAAMTFVGLLLLPFVLIFSAIAWSSAYLAGAYFAGLRIASQFTAVSSNLSKLVVLAVSLVVAGLLTLVPFLGWLFTLLLVTFGMGVVAALIMTSWSERDRERLSRSSKSDTIPRATSTAS